MAFIYEFIPALHGIRTLGSVTMIIFGTYWIFVSITEDIKIALLNINPEQSEMELFKELSEFIKLYSNTKQLSALIRLFLLNLVNVQFHFS